MPVRAPRLPGIRFEAQAPPVADVLPRMDVAAFVGFAASGPLRAPAAVEDPARFAEVFGADLDLAWDPARGEPSRAYLAPAVRGFFRNGGRRCWIVRVAGPRAQRNWFPVPGLFRLGGSGELGRAFAPARSEGGWSDGLSVGAALTIDPVRVLGVGVGLASLVVALARSIALVAGDLLRLTFAAEGCGALFGINGVVGGPADGTATLAGRPLLWFRVNPSASVLGPGLSGALLQGGSAREVKLLKVTAGPGSEPAVVARLDLNPEDAPEPGTTLRIHLDPSPLWLTIETVTFTPDPGRAGGYAVEVAGRGLWQFDRPPALASVPTAERLTMQIQANIGGSTRMTLDGLGFGAHHPRAWSALPSDDELFGDPAGLGRGQADLRGEATTPRFPLAGWASSTGWHVPIALPASAELGLGAVPSRRTPLERDGLARFGAGLFLDPALLDAGLDALPTMADFVRDTGPRPRPLAGLHAVLGIDEATLVAVPDAVHRGWSRADLGAPPPAGPSSPLAHPEWWHFLPCNPPAAIPRAPAPERDHFLACDLRVLASPRMLPPTLDAAGTIGLAWVSGEADATFVLEEATSPDFSDTEVIATGEADQQTLLGRAPGDYYFRVRVEAGGLTSDWSKGVALRVAGDRLWQVDPPASGPAATGTLRDVHRALLRACAARGDLLALLTLPPEACVDDAIAHANALRSARLLNGPFPLVRPLGGGEGRALSHGALVHPWLYVTDEGGPEALRLMPPDGSYAGIIARRSIERGAWIAPANEPWRDVVDLSPTIAAGRRLDLQDGRVNLVRQEPRGFVTLDESTLSDDDDLRPIHVRRLLALVRRLALRLGPGYVFEPHDAILRRSVRRGFESALSEMFARGAFAGATPDTSYRVDVDAGPDPDGDAARGRMVVELRLAPSQPLAFLTVRLVQQGDRRLVEEG